MSAQVLIEFGEERVVEGEVAAEERRFVLEVRRAEPDQFVRRPVRGTEFDGALAFEDAALPVNDGREPGGVVSQANGDAISGEVLEPRPRVRIGLEEGSAVADDAHRYPGKVLVDDGLRNLAVIEIPGCDVETLGLGVDHSNELGLGIMDGREIDPVLCGPVLCSGRNGGEQRQGRRERDDRATSQSWIAGPRT